MEFRILGPVQAHAEGRAVSLAGRKQRALLALLLLHANEAVSADRLIDGLWTDTPPADAAKALQVYVSRLRKALADEARLTTTAGGYLLHLTPGELDRDRFEELAAVGREALANGDPGSAAKRLREALELWHGPPLADLAYEPFAQTEIARLEDLRVAALQDRIDADLALGRHAELTGELESLVKANPLRERLRGQLMLALYRCGRQADALDAYQAARQTLVDELGIEPGRALQDLERAILQHDPALDAPAPPAHAQPGRTDDDPTAELTMSVFVGRESELTELVTGLEDAFAGRGRLFLLVGEPGIGKSRLAEELVSRARSRGAEVLVGRCWEAGGAPAYWPWVQSLRTHVRGSDTAALRLQLGAGAADVAQIVPELRQRLPDLPEPRSLESEGARFRLFDATADFLRNASESRPILLVLDDLHAADTPSLLLLQFIARELGSTHTLLLGALRDVDPVPAEPLTALLAEVVREPVTRRLSLGGLSERNVAEYVELMASELASPELVAALHEETEGNPLFVTETVRLLSVEGVGPGPNGAARRAIPQSIRDVISRRLAHLSEECNQLLVLASVLGREFALAGLARASGASEEELLETLDEAMAARVVSEVPGGPDRLRFAHVLIRDALYEGLTPARRVRLHRLAVQALEAPSGGVQGPQLAELAHHSVAGRDFEKGLSYARRAGDRALALLAHEEAARLYRAALEALDLSSSSDEEARCELLLSLGEAEVRAGNSLPAKRAFLEAAGIARRLGLAGELARAAAGYGGRIVSARAGGDDRLVPLLEEGLAALAEEDVELRARLLARLAAALRDEPSRDRRDRLSREAVELARSMGNPGALTYALAGRAAAISGPDTVAERLALGGELRELSERIGDRERVVQGHFLELVARLQVGDVRKAEVDLAAASRIADELQQPAQLWAVCAARAMLALSVGGLADAEELVSKALALGERAQPGMAIPAYRLQRYALCDFQGRLEEAETMIADSVVEYEARPVFRCALAHLYAKLGRLPEAGRAFDELAGDDFSGLPFDGEWLYGMCLLAETNAALKDTDPAAVLYKLLLPYAAFNVVDAPEVIRGSVSHYLGVLAATMSRWDEAARHFEDALEMNQGMGARPWLAYAQHDFARMLLGRRWKGDGKRAVELLREAGDTAAQVGMTALSRRVTEDATAAR